MAILLGPNATLIDFAGPWEILGAAAYSCAGFNAYSVAATNRIGRVFSREMAMTPAKFVEAVRVETARGRLEETGRSLKKVAQECGFRNAHAMGRVFKRVPGVGPAQYREHFRSDRSTHCH